MSSVTLSLTSYPSLALFVHHGDTGIDSIASKSCDDGAGGLMAQWVHPSGGDSVQSCPLMRTRTHITNIRWRMVLRLCCTACVHADFVCLGICTDVCWGMVALSHTICGTLRTNIPLREAAICVHIWVCVFVCVLEVHVSGHDGSQSGTVSNRSQTSAGQLQSSISLSLATVSSTSRVFHYRIHSCASSFEKCVLELVMAVCRHPVSLRLMPGMWIKVIVVRVFVFVSACAFCVSQLTNHHPGHSQQQGGDEGWGTDGQPQSQVGQRGLWWQDRHLCKRGGWLHNLATQSTRNSLWQWPLF